MTSSQALAITHVTVTRGQVSLYEISDGEYFVIVPRHGDWTYLDSDGHAGVPETRKAGLLELVRRARHQAMLADPQGWLKVTGE